MTPFNFFVLFFKRHPLIWVQRSKSMVENFKEQIRVGLTILSSLQSKLLLSPSFITYSSNYLQRKTIHTSVDLKKQTSAMACKGPSIEKQACGNKHSSSRKKNCLTRQQIWSYQEKISNISTSQQFFKLLLLGMSRSGRHHSSPATTN